MSAYTVMGVPLNSVYDINGTNLTDAYDIDGNSVFASGDYDEYDTEYQHAILTARNAWQTEYRTDDSVIPVIIHTDQHRHLNSSHKSTFDYLARAIKWQEVSAIIGLGDVCGAVYNATDLNAMTNCLSSLPAAKQINVYGNHDCQLKKTEGSSYAYAPLTDDLYHTLQDTFFNNSGYGSNNSDTRYGYKGMEYIIDPLTGIKFCVFAVWVTRGDPWYHYYMDAETVNSMITMLSSTDGRDIVILSHIQPYGEQTMWYKPAVDGNEETTTTGTRSSISYLAGLAIDDMIADRKARRAGSITDCDGMVHPYDFRSVTSDVLCCLNGHSHTDIYGYSPDGSVPSITFDAYGYDDYPLYFVNIDRTRERINVWKFDEANQIYNYQVPFMEVTT